MSQPGTITALRVHALPLGAIATNCYVVHRAGSDRAVVIDPGAEPERVTALLREQELTAEAVLVTHCHWDHIGAVAPLARELDVPVYMSRIEAPVLENISDYAPAQFGPYEPYAADHLLDGGERIEVAGIEFEVIHLPGHSPGTMGFYHEAVDVRSGEAGASQAVPQPAAAQADSTQAPSLFIGDLIFRDSVGRSDLPGADGGVLLQSAKMLLDRLDDAVVLYPGHGDPTTIGRERVHNPFLRQLG